MAEKVYLYSRFERFWHWFQAILILVLLLTGFEIHGSYTLLGFERAVKWHDISAWTLLGLTAFAIFWHFTTGEWRHYLPIREKMAEICYYYACGIFKGECHPHEKHPEKKLNALQRLAYLFLKIFIFPLLFVTGLLYYYNQSLGISFGSVAILHSAGAFLMLAFLILHSYLTTTGKTPLSHLKGMLTGWEEIENSSMAQGPTQNAEQGP